MRAPEERRPKHGPWAAAPALSRLITNPDDTTQVFTIVEALSFGSLERIRARLRRTPGGRRILEARPDLLAALSDRSTLGAMPERSLGRAYLDFLREEAISTDGLVSASDAGYSGVLPPGEDDEELAYVADRLRDMHDLWHVATGYHGDLLGETALLAFTFAQTRIPGVATIAAAGWLRAARVGGRPLVADGFRRGVKAAWLPEQPWEDLLSMPLGAARRVLGLSPPPDYAALRTRDLARGPARWRWERNASAQRELA